MLEEGGLSPEEEDDLLVTQISSDPVIQKHSRGVVRDSRALVERFDQHFEKLKVESRIEACVEKCKGSFEARSEELRDPDGPY